MAHVVSGDTARGRHVVWVSTDRATRGGVAGMVNMMLDTELTEQWPVTHVATHCDGSALRKMLTFLVGTVHYLRLLVSTHPLLVHIHTASYGSFVRKSLLTWTARAFGVPVVLHVHGAEFHLFFRSLPRPLRAYVTATLTTAQAVIALGPGWSRRLAEIAPAAHITVVPNSVRPRPAVAQPRGDQPVSVLFLGRVGDRKGAFDLITAWHGMLADGVSRPVHLTIAGDGEVDRARGLVVELGIDATVDVVGWVAPTAVPALIAAAHVLVLPSHDEGQPMALLEAMAGGLCVVTTPVGGIPDLVDDTCALFVSPGDPAGLQAALTRVVTDDDARAALGRAALARVHSTFDVDVVWRRIDALYRELTGVNPQAIIPRPLRVTHIVPDLRVGGAERHVTALMPGLDRNRFTPSVVCIGEPGALFPTLVGAGVSAVALRRTRREALRATIGLVRTLRRLRPDVVLTRGYNADMLGRVASIVAGVPHRIVWIHHHADVDDRPRARRIADRLLDRFTTAYFGVAQSQRAFLVDVLGYPERKVHIIHNGVDPEVFDTARDRAVLADSRIADATGIVGTVSAMRPEKDHPTFLRAAAAVTSTHPGVGFLVVGDGPERDRIESLAADLGVAGSTEFTGSRSDVGALLSSMDVFVLSSHAVECFPMALLEAMASGIPAVCTDVGGVGEMIVDGETGFLVPPDDQAALAGAITRLLDDPDTAARMGAAARARVEREFSLDAMVTRTQDVLTQLTTTAHTVPSPSPIHLTVVMDLTFVGGAEMLWLALFRAIDRSAVSPRILCLREEGPLAGDFRAAGVPVEVLPPSSSRDPRRVLRLAQALRRTGTDVVLVAHHHRAALAIGRAGALLAGIPSVVAAHDMDLTSVGDRVLPRSAVATLRTSAALVLLSQGQGHYLHRAEGVGRHRWSRTREVVIGNGIELPAPTTPADRVIARHRMRVGEADVAIGVVARLSAQKAHEVLFAAFEKCLATQPHAVLVVIGTGDREQELHDLAKDRGIDHRVRFLGVRRDVPELLGGLDMSCLSSVHEGVPMILIESLAAGVPVVATDCGSVAEVITDGVDGYVVDVGDSDTMAERLVTLAADPDLRRRLGAQGRAAAQARFDIHRTAQEYQDLLREVTGR